MTATKSALDDILDRFDAMTTSERKELLEDVYDATSDVVWTPLTGPQSNAYFSQADELFYGGSAGGGKGLLYNEKIATPFGFRQISELKVGSRIFARDGSITKVIGVYPQPVQQVYRIQFADGAEIITDGPHKWNYKVARNRDGWKVGTTEQLMDMMEKGKRLLIPLCDPVNFTKLIDRGPISPYVLGLLLGDGYTAQNGAGAKWSFSSQDKELVDALHGDWVKDTKYDYRLRGEWREIYFQEYKRLGLEGCKAHNKFIPEEYKYRTVSERLEILCGLMDTDGYITQDGKAYFTSTSQQLAEDVRWLVLSLGGRATITSKTPVCTNGADGRVEGREAWTAYIRMPDNSDIVKLDRKKRLAKKYNGGRMELKRRIVSINPCGQEKTICIAVDHPESLYIASEDFIVTHNTDLGIGLALNEHEKVLFLRREADSALDAFNRVEEIAGDHYKRNLNTHTWIRESDSKTQRVRFAGCKDEGTKQKYKGRPHDLYVFDEIGDFLKSQYTFIKTWNRSATKGQRCRVLCTGNPPTTPEGLWVIEYWGAWLDPKHPNPAKDGELRWYATDERGVEHEVDGVGPHKIEHEDGSVEEVYARSRTFIRAKLEDNPYLVETDYGRNLDALPIELRRAYRDGRFDVALEDNPRQVIPTNWITLAQERWRDRYKGKPPEGVPMCAIGVDIAQGGPDDTVLAPRYDAFYPELKVIDGKDTPNGASVLSQIVQIRRDRALPVVDMGGGYGGATGEKLTENGIEYSKYKGSSGSTARSKCKNFTFYNKRAEAYWRFREALDPEQAGGSDMALPDDPRLVADLTAVLYDVKRGKDVTMQLKITPKEDLVESLGRSPDRGDAVVMAWTDGVKAGTHATVWQKKAKGQQQSQANMGYKNRRR